MVASLRESVDKGTKEDESNTGCVWVCWISQCYGPLSLGARLETYEAFISSIFQIFFGPR